MSLNRQNSKKQSFMSYFVDTAKFSSIGIIITIIIMFIASFAVTNVEKHERLYSLIAIVFQCLPSFISSRIIGRKFSRSLLLLGILQSACVFTLYILLSLIVVGTNIDYSNVIKSLPYIITSGVVGSVTSGAKRKKHRYS